MWHSNRQGNYDIFYSNSTDGANWSEPVVLISDKSTDMYPFLLQDCTGTYWLTWTSDRSDVYGDIWYSVSEDGLKWSAPIQVTKTSSRDYTPRLFEDSSGVIWIIYVSDRSGNLDIWYSKLAKSEG